MRDVFSLALKIAAGRSSFKVEAPMLHEQSTPTGINSNAEIRLPI